MSANPYEQFRQQEGAEFLNAHRQAQTSGFDVVFGHSLGGLLTGIGTPLMGSYGDAQQAAMNYQSYPTLVPETNEQRLDREWREEGQRFAAEMRAFEEAELARARRASIRGTIFTAALGLALFAWALVAYWVP
jgi:hypothetical protein